MDVIATCISCALVGGSGQPSSTFFLAINFVGELPSYDDERPVEPEGCSTIITTTQPHNGAFPPGLHQQEG
jgi:hypothetical protein